MVYLMQHIRTLIMILVCINPIMIMASDYRNLPVPSLYGVKDNGSRKDSKFQNFVVIPSFMFASGVRRVVNVIDIKEMLRSIDFSPITAVVHDNRRMLGVAIGAMGILLIAHRIQKSEAWKKWFTEKYSNVSASIENNTKSFIENAPVPVRLALTPLQKLAVFLSNCIVKYIGMNESTIISSISSPVLGRLVDCVWTCPIPLVNFTSIGFVASGGILAKGYFDQSFSEVNTKLNNLDTNNTSLHTITQQKVEEVKEKIKNISKKIKSIKQGIELSEENIIKKTDLIEQKVKEGNVKLVEIALQIMDITQAVNSIEQKGDQQSQLLTVQLEELKKSYLEAHTRVDSELKMINNHIKEMQEGTKHKLECLEKKIDKADQENQQMHGHTQQKIDDVNIKIEELFQGVSGLTEELKGINIVESKVDDINEKVENLGQKLINITNQISLIQDAKDEKNDKLSEQLILANNKFDKAKEDFVQLVEILVQQEAKKTSIELDSINKTMLQIDGRSVEQAGKLQGIQVQIGQLLDKQEANGKKFIELLDKVNSSNLSLEETKLNMEQNNTVLQNMQNMLEKVQKIIDQNKNEILVSINDSIHQCADLSSRMSKLEIKVESNEKYTKEMFEKLIEKNKKLKKQIILLEKKREQEFNDWKENHKKENDALRKDFDRTAQGLSSEIKGVKNEIISGFKDMKSNSQSQITYMLPPRNEVSIVHPNSLSIDMLKKQQLQIELGKS